MLKEASQYDAKVVEQKIQKFWDEIDAYSRVRELRNNGKKFFFVDGPPYTTGRIHLGQPGTRSSRIPYCGTVP